MITVGIDMHVRNSYLHVTDDWGDVLRHGRCRNTMGDLAGFLSPIEQEARRRGERPDGVGEHDQLWRDPADAEGVRDGIGGIAHGGLESPNEPGNTH